MLSEFDFDALEIVLHTTTLVAALLLILLFYFMYGMSRRVSKLEADVADTLYAVHTQRECLNDTHDGLCKAISRVAALEKSSKSHDDEHHPKGRVLT